jgi:hypothetical protein
MTMRIDFHLLNVTSMPIDIGILRIFLNKLHRETPIMRVHAHTLSALNPTPHCLCP